MNYARIVKILKKGGVGVLPTDTLYGLVGSALSKKAVARIYKLRRRDKKKQMIVLIGSPRDLKLFGVKPDGEAKKVLDKIWPGKVSVVLPCRLKKFEYLHRGAKTIVFRVPKKANLLRFLKKDRSSSSAQCQHCRPAADNNHSRSEKIFWRQG